MSSEDDVAESAETLPGPSIVDKNHAGRLATALTLLYASLAAPWLIANAPFAGVLLAALVLAAALIALSVIDAVSLRLPDAITLPLLLAGLASTWLDGRDLLLWHAVSALAGGLALYGVGALYRHYRGREGLGLGDVKLFAAAGAWIGAENLASVLLVACGTALLAALVARAHDDRFDRRSAMPFGPFIALGLWVIWLYGPLV